MIKHYLPVILILVLSLFLRFSNLSNNPPSPYWEEVALGYDAYSILKTGKDHHGNFLPVVAFESFGDWKPSLYFYSIIPFIYLFDLSILAVRFPSALAGFFLVLVIACLAKLLGKSNKFFLVGLMVAGFSPWAIQFSRAGWEVNLATFFLSLSMLILFFLLKKNEIGNLAQIKKYLYWFGIVFFLILSAYTYHATRIIAPVLGMGGFVLWLLVERQNNHKDFLRKNFVLSVFIFLISLIMFLPILKNISNKEVGQRFAETSIFSNLSLIEKSNTLKEVSGDSLLSNLMFHRYFIFSQQILNNFIDHFSLDFLFISGDINPRHNTGFTGQLYHIEVVFFIFGLISIFKNKNKYQFFILFWLLVGILPASITTVTPHALRILPSMPAFLIVIAFGIIYWLDLMSFYFKSKNITNIFAGMTIILYLVSLSYFWRSYNSLYPKHYSGEWQYGYEYMIKEVSALMIKYPELPVYISRHQGRPAMYYWFYTKTAPQTVQHESLTAKKDQSEFLEFDNIKFINTTDEIITKPAIIAISSNNISFEIENHLDIANLASEAVWKVGITR